jgi:hypothetical protein
LSTIASDQALIEVLATEISNGIHKAVNFWMLQIEDALRDPRLTTLGRMHAVEDIVKRYHRKDDCGANHDGHAA